MEGYRNPLHDDDDDQRTLTIVLFPNVQLSSRHFPPSLHDPQQSPSERRFSSSWTFQPSPSDCPAPVTPLPPSYPCSNLVESVPFSLVCDHRKDCTDGSDESFCVHPPCAGQKLLRCGQSAQVSQTKHRLRPIAHWRRFKIRRQASAPSDSADRATDTPYHRMHSNTRNTHTHTLTHTHTHICSKA